MNFSILDWLATILVVVGALNWGLIGIFNVDLIGAILGNMSFFARLIYILVGAAGAWQVYRMVK